MPIVSGADRYDFGTQKPEKKEDVYEVQKAVYAGKDRFSGD